MSEKIILHIDGRHACQFYRDKSSEFPEFSYLIWSEHVTVDRIMGISAKWPEQDLEKLTMGDFFLYPCGMVDCGIMGIFFLVEYFRNG